MAGELEAVVRGMFEGLDKGDASFAMANFAEDAQSLIGVTNEMLSAVRPITAVRVGFHCYNADSEDIIIRVFAGI